MVEYVIAAGFFFIKKNGSIELSLLLYYFFCVCGARIIFD